MLELTHEQISMGQVAVDKSAALHLLAEKLVADGLVAEGYLSGLQAREAQGSTFLGQGIAIPHGTPETRDQVFATGVRLLQFPEGVDWGDGQIVYLAIGIAAKSDEHLRLLQLLTRALGETDLGQALRRAGSAEALLKLLQGAPQELALDAQMISLGVSADDFEELVWRGARLLRQADCVSNGFAAVLQQVDALPLGDGLWWLHSEQTVKRPGLAFVTPDKPMRYLGQPLNGLFCLASLGEAHQTLLERLCALLIEGRGQELGRATSSRAVLEVLGGELPPDWPSARITLANAHGLHARPAKILAQLAKSFDGDLRVRIIDGPVGAVSVKSLSKLLSLGAHATVKQLLLAAGVGSGVDQLRLHLGQVALGRAQLVLLIGGVEVGQYVALLDHRAHIVIAPHNAPRHPKTQGAFVARFDIAGKTAQILCQLGFGHHIQSRANRFRRLFFRAGHQHGGSQR